MKVRTSEKYEEQWNKIRGLIKSKINNSDNYDEKYMKIKFNSDYDLPLKILGELYNMVIVTRSVFLWGQQILPASFFQMNIYINYKCYILIKFELMLIKLKALKSVLYLSLLVFVR